ncbi:hypothetical protein APH_0599 [Anaplasma phagocytophilum str. HZ]|uniref:Uncharacterized protein n=1 Tax=Anaplasma phagocytophilum (strain HZ) TaxID=212042 RepID=Q2GKB2_ANAPZ|nr:hypothetical protein APH_0599 [Anaplasma phagocytophilum str. HZ]
MCWGDILKVSRDRNAVAELYKGIVLRFIIAV